RQQLDVVVPRRDRALLLLAEPGGIAAGPAPVVVEDPGQLAEEDLLQREASPVEAVARAPRVPVVAHGGDRLALVELGPVAETQHFADALWVVLDGRNV